MKNINPFDITFGKEPVSLISRESDISEIKNSYLSECPSSQVYILTGSRGSGKTVSLTTICNSFRKVEKWIVVEINPETEILEQLASKIYDEGKLQKLFLKADFSFSFKGFGLNISGDTPVSNVSTFLKKEFEYLKKKNYKVLISIDEISSNEHVRVFAHEFQIFLRNGYNVFLLMTGLYQNINSLENVKTLTFLKRAPKIELNSLNMRAVVNSYKKIFDISEEESIQLAKLTAGYPYAYQLLGNILFKNNSHTLTDDIMDEFDEEIQEGAYSLIYEELTSREQEILKSVCKNNSNQAVIDDLGISKTQLSNYKRVLIKKGVIDQNRRDRLIIKLPRFKEYIQFLINLE